MAEIIQYLHIISAELACLFVVLGIICILVFELLVNMPNTNSSR
jgi:hypothetical protein